MCEIGIEDYIDKELQSKFKNEFGNKVVEMGCLSINYLTRFRTLGDKCKLIEALNDDKLYFSTALGYNDPYDTLMYVNSESVLEHIKFMWETDMKAYITRLSKTEPVLGIYAGAMGSPLNPNKKNLEEGFLEKIIDKIDELKINMQKNIKGICLTTDFRNALMWAHYADGHKGLALLYDKKELVEAKAYSKINELIEEVFLLRRINYSNTRVDATSFINDYILKTQLTKSYSQKFAKSEIIPEPNLATIEDIILNKNKAWSYENEVRLIPKNINIEKESQVSYLRIRPKVILLGAKISISDCHDVATIARNKGIKMYRATLNENQIDYNIDLTKYS